MKGKSEFTAAEIEQTRALIAAKNTAPREKQKGIRDQMRALGFYISDYPISPPCVETDLQRLIEEGLIKVIESADSRPTVPAIRTTAVSAASGSARSTSDEAYIIDLCDELLGRVALRQHRFAFLVGDSGKPLPVDAYYPSISLVIEYRERQHTEEVAFFNRRMTVSGVLRGEQRKLYDQRRREILPQHRIDLVEISFTDFECSRGGRLRRNRVADVEVLRERLVSWLQGS